MPANTVPIFPNVLNSQLSQLSVANTNRDGTTGTYVTIFTPGANGSRINKITITASVTTTAGVIRLFVSNGSVSYLYKELIVYAITPSTTVAVWSYSLFFPGEAGILLPSGWTLKASTHNAESFTVFVEGADY